MKLKKEFNNALSYFSNFAKNQIILSFFIEEIDVSLKDIELKLVSLLKKLKKWI